jgi:hypothetical protein
LFAFLVVPLDATPRIGVAVDVCDNVALLKKENKKHGITTSNKVNEQTNQRTNQPTSQPTSHPDSPLKTSASGDRQTQPTPMSLPNAFSFDFDSLDCFPGGEGEALKDVSAVQHLDLEEDLRELDILKLLAVSEHATQREASFYCLARVLQAIGTESGDDIHKLKDLEELESIFTADIIPQLGDTSATFAIQRSAAHALCGLCQARWLHEKTSEPQCAIVSEQSTRQLGEATNAVSTQLEIRQRVAAVLLDGCNALLCRTLQTEETDEVSVDSCACMETLSVKRDRHSPHSCVCHRLLQRLIPETQAAVDSLVFNCAVAYTCDNRRHYILVDSDMLFILRCNVRWSLVQFR